MSLLRETPEWQELTAHHGEVEHLHLREQFAADPGRGTSMTAEAAGIFLDYSKNRITPETLGLLVNLAEATGMPARRDAMFRGEHINSTEDRAVLHVALRMPANRSLVVDGVDVVKEVHEVLGRMAGLQRVDPLRRVARLHRQADQEHRQHRDRRLRPRAGHGLHGAAALLTP